MPDVSTNGTTEVSTEIDATPDEVFALLADGWAYDKWVVGAKRIRAVDPDWPAEGSRFHHEVGIGPASVKDSSKVLAVDPPHHLQMEVRFRPAGVAVVDLRLEPLDDGRTKVVMRETPTRGAARALAMATSLLLLVRNEWSLMRLKRVVTERVAEPAR